MSSYYILYSKSLDKYYSGITTESAEVRLEKHNSGAYGKRFTSAATDWTIQLEITAVDYPHARRMELYVKKRKSRSYIKALILSRSEQEKLIERNLKSSR